MRRSKRLSKEEQVQRTAQIAAHIEKNGMVVYDYLGDPSDVKASERKESVKLTKSKEKADRRAAAEPRHVAKETD
jgi:hypothetical protein